MKKLEQINGIKGIACIFVVLCHYYAILGNGILSNVAFSNILKTGYTKGYWAVEMFFMISGFLISYQYKNKIQNMRASEFISKRLKSLYPTYFIATIIGIIITFIDIILTDGKVVSKPLDFWNIILSFSLLKKGYVINSGNPLGMAMWFICVLFLCYLIYYFIAKKLKSTSYVIFICFMIFIGWICIDRNLNIPFLYYDNGRGYITFFIGVILYEIYSQKFNKVLVSYILTIVSIFVVIIGRIFNEKNIYGNELMVMITLVYPTIIFASLNIGGRLLALFPFKILGRMSTAIFVCHAPIMTLIKIFDLYWNLEIPYNSHIIFLAIMILIGCVSLGWYLIIEQRFLPYMTTIIIDKFRCQNIE